MSYFPLSQARQGTNASQQVITGVKHAGTSLRAIILQAVTYACTCTQAFKCSAPT